MFEIRIKGKSIQSNLGLQEKRREEKRREEKRRQYLKDPVPKIFYGKLLQKYLIGLGFFSFSQ